MKSSRLFSLSNPLAMSAILASLLTPAAAYANSNGAPPGYSGAPGENNCSACHASSLTNPGAGNLTITFPDANGYVPGRKYSIRVTLQDPTAKRWGFELTARQAVNTTLAAGAFAVPSGSTAVKVVTLGPEQYMTQSLTGTYAQQVTQAAWDVDWTAPAAGTGPLQFFASGLASNNDGTPSLDLTYTFSLSVLEQTGTTSPPSVATGSSVLPQFVFGGGWYTAMYFTNQSAAQVSVNVNFYTDSATVLAVGGDTVKTILIPAGGTSILEAQNTGSLTSGWATFSLPSGVSGYGVFRQSVAGKADQEAVVPFASSTGTRTLLTFDETHYTTSVAIWYDGPSSGAVALTAEDESGNSLGTVTLTMTPGTKRSFALASELPMISGHLGSLVVSTSSGTVAVLGLRFGGSSFTSIPPSN
jgi:hypothetical protein